MLRALRVRPNAAHVALPKALFASIAANMSFVILTQASDSLCSLAIREELKRTGPGKDSSDDPDCSKCMGDHSISSARSSSLLLTILLHLSALVLPEQNLLAKNKRYPRISTDLLPRCVYCGGPARPGIVWWGEDIPQREE